jgi:4-alpha-glucanotransferase
VVPATDRTVLNISLFRYNKHPTVSARGRAVSGPCLPCAASGLGAWRVRPEAAHRLGRADGMKLVQISINDTTATHTWMDSYPYAAISVFVSATQPIHPRRHQAVLMTAQESQPSKQEFKRQGSLLIT